MFWAAWDFNFQLPLPVALSAVALIGYMLGRSRREVAPRVKHQARRELKRAKTIVRELETTLRQLRTQVTGADEHAARFKTRVLELTQHQDKDEAWAELCREADLLLRPTQRLVSQVSACYDELRQHCTQLLGFTEVRTDPLTGVSNRRALDESLNGKLALFKRYDSGFALVIVDIDHFKKVNDEQGHLYGDEVLTLVAKLLDESVRDTDQVTRYGGEEFVILMPHTPLEGAAIFADRLRQRVEAALPVTISLGVAVAQAGDTTQALLARADAGLYAAKKAGRNQVFLHDGQAVVSYLREQAELTEAELNFLARCRAQRRQSPPARDGEKNLTAKTDESGAFAVARAEAAVQALLETNPPDPGE